MNTMSWFVDGSFSTRLTLSLLHFLWQGCCAGMVVFVGGLLLRNASAGIRYSLNLAAMLAMAACLPMTFLLLDVPSGGADARQILQSSHEFNASRNPYRAFAQAAEFDTGQLADKTTGSTESAGANLGPDQEASINTATMTPSQWLDAILFRSRNNLQTFSRWVVALYFCGVAMVLGRLLQGVWGGHQLRKMATVITEAALLDSVRKLARQLGLKTAPTVAWCEQISVPVVVGVVRPMILLPTAIVSGLTPDQLQAILLHELSHIRRLDPIVNLLQRIIEAILFFHPVVWFVSRRIYAERENAADDMVLAAGWDRPLYADALVRVAELASSLSKPDTELGATLLGIAGSRPSEFKLRIMRLLGSRPPTLDISRTGISLALALAALIVGGSTLFAWSQVGKWDRSSDNRSSLEESMETESQVDAPSNASNTPMASCSLSIKYDMPGAEAEARIFVERIDPEFQAKQGRRDEYGSDEYGGIRFSRLRNGDSLTLSDLPAGKYCVARYRMLDIVRQETGKAQSSVYLDRQWIELADPGTQSVSLSRPAGQSIVGRVVIPPDLTVNTLAVHVCSENARSSGSLNHRDVMHFDAQNADAEGKFKMEPLPPGRYKIFVEGYANHNLALSGIIAPSWGATSEVTINESVEPAALELTLSPFDREQWLEDQTEAESSHSNLHLRSRATGLLPDGEELEVVGVAHANIATPNGTQRKANGWWNADGTPLDNEPFNKLQLLSVAPEQSHFREFVIRMKGRPVEPATPKNARTRKRYGGLWFGAQHERHCAITSDEDGHLLYQVVAGFAKEDPSGIAFYYSNAPTIDAGTIGTDGKVEASANASDPIKAWLQDVKVAGVEKSATETAVKLNRSYSQITSMQVVVIAIAVDGTIVMPNPSNTPDRFVFNLALSDIDVFQIRVRPMTHRVDCEDLSLLPTQRSEPKVTVTPLDELATVTFRKDGRTLGILAEIRLKGLPGLLKLLQSDLNSETAELVIETHRAETHEEVRRIVAALNADGWKWPKINLKPMRKKEVVSEETDGLAVKPAVGKTSDVSQPKQSTDELANQIQTMLLRFVGGKKQEPLSGLQVKITSGNNGDTQKNFGTFTTDEFGTIKVSLPQAFYDLHLKSDKELPYLDVEAMPESDVRQSYAALDLNVTHDGPSKWLNGKKRDDGIEPAAAPSNLPRVTYTLIPACELTLRAVDVETGKGLAGAEFYQELAAGEEWGHPVYSDNIGDTFDTIRRISSESDLTDDNGNFRRWVGKLTEDTKFGALKPPPGYLPVVPLFEVPVITKIGQARAEHVFEFRRIRWDVKVEPEKKKLKLGEPIWLTFTVTNCTNESRGLELGSEYLDRLGRSEACKVKVVTNDATQMPIPDAGMSEGGASSIVLLKPNGEVKVKLFLPDWATITKPGHYRVYLESELKLFPIKTQNGEHIEWDGTPELASIEALGEFDVVPPEATVND